MQYLDLTPSGESNPVYFYCPVTGTCILEPGNFEPSAAVRGYWDSELGYNPEKLSEPMAATWQEFVGSLEDEWVGAEEVEKFLREYDAPEGLAVHISTGSDFSQTDLFLIIDLSLLRVGPHAGDASTARVVQEGDLWILDGAPTTPAGCRVESRSKPVIDAILEEWEERGGLNAEEFGMFSVYSTHAEFVRGKQIFETGDLLNELVEADHFLGGGCGSPHCEQGCFHAAPDVMPRVVAALGLPSGCLDDPSSHSEHILRALGTYLSSLTEYRQTATVLLNGMYRIDVSLLVAFHEGLVDIARVSAQPYAQPEEMMAVMRDVSVVETWITLASQELPSS